MSAQVALDPTTLLLVTTLLILVTSTNYAMVWLQDRRETSLLWMMASSVLGAISFVLRVSLPPAAGILLGNIVLLVAIGCVWMGCRTIRRGAPRPEMIAVAPVVWVGISYLPGFLGHASLRVAAVNLLAAPLLLLAGREIWRLDGHRSFARYWVAGILTFQGLGCLGCGLYNILLPTGPAEKLESIRGFTLFVSSSAAFALLISFGLVALIKERSERLHREEAMLDALTGLGNRRALDAQLVRYAATAQRRRRPLSVVMIDTDLFKAYNDFYGHPEGDACLRDIANTLRGGLVRRSDVVMRYGGEEFVVLLPETDADEAMKIAERLRLAIRSLARPHLGCERGIVTISLGVASLEFAPEVRPASDLLRAADRALYRAKRLGRDRTVQDGDEEAQRSRPPGPHLRIVS
jgi:diguanylate cyclase (GGDEF)-like protein